MHFNWVDINSLNKRHLDNYVVKLEKHLSREEHIAEEHIHKEIKHTVDIA